MKYKQCCFIGHRTIELTQELTQRVKSVIEKLILEYSVGVFLFGSRSEFDTLCLSIVTELKEKYPYIKRIAYTCQSEGCILQAEKAKWDRVYSSFYNTPTDLLCVDEEFEYKSKYTAGRASYVERNQAMIDNSDYCVFYYNENYKPPQRQYFKKSPYYQTKSGTQLAYQYAKRKKKSIINILTN